MKSNLCIAVPRLNPALLKVRVCSASNMSGPETCAPIVIPPLHNTMGALFVGVAIAGALWGITTMQTYTYFMRYYGIDRPVINIMVGTVYALDTVHQFMISHLLYTYLVTNWGNPVILGTLVWSILIMVLMTGFIAVIVQLFLVYRVWILSHRNYYVVGVILLPVCGVFGTTMAYFARAWPFTTFAQLALVGGLSRAVNVLGAVSDVIITAALSYYLWKSKSGIKRTDAIMNRLILFCVRTGLLTTACAILSLITISVFPTTFIYITFYATLARFYSFSLLATLNARAELVRSQGGFGSFATSLTLEGGSSSYSSRRPPTEHSSSVRHITIKQETETTHEFEMKSHPYQVGGGNKSVAV
ncbi:hypothetical protein E1B28_006406 [Marasmius oreades]|uniref:DUF6534 domain-containing protein n=1 Tax=Marasmius oreades TaxID=181124 RepID=A0A9P7S649_9AGAR|nr:uncharacterized protein E1B28_006406 [Marasmius oreades]KAG7095692.1 hypothetical protein E1B28_006406 [Marasmius oreades]